MLRPWQYSVTHFDCNHLGHVIVLWQVQKILCYCTVFALIHFEFEGNFQVQVPRGLYLKGRFNERVFELPVWGAYIWRGLFSEFYGILNSRQDRSNGLLSQARFLPCLRYLWACVRRRGPLI